MNDEKPTETDAPSGSLHRIVRHPYFWFFLVFAVLAFWGEAVVAGIYAGVFLGIVLEETML